MLVPFEKGVGLISAKPNKFIDLDGKVRYICKECGDIFEPTDKWRSKSWCNIKCAIKHKNRVKSEYYKKRRERNNLKSEHKPVRYEKRKCAYCQKEFQWYSKAPSQKYCSKECREAATKERYSRKAKTRVINDEDQVREYVKYLVRTMNYYGEVSNVMQCFLIDNFASERIKKDALERDNHRCRICGRNTSLEVHHIRKRRDGGGNDLDNLVTLCSSCHRAVETGDEQHAVKKCIKRWKDPHDRQENTIDYKHKAKCAEKEIRKLYEILSNDGEACGIKSIKICLDKILDELEK